MYEHQLDTYSLTLDEATIENAEACTLRRIRRKKEEIRLLRLIRLMMIRRLRIETVSIDTVAENRKIE